MIEIKILTADRQQVRQVSGLPEFTGQEYLNTTLDSINQSDIEWPTVSVFHDSLRTNSLENSSASHNQALSRAESLGARVVINHGGGVVPNSMQCLEAHCRNPDTKYILLLEDDVIVSKSIINRLYKWLEKTPDLKFGNLYDVCGFGRPTINPKGFWGAQGLLIATDIIPDLIHGCINFEELVTKPFGQIPGGADINYSRVAGLHLGHTLYNATPSLVQHIGLETSWGGGYAHKTSHFEPN